MLPDASAITKIVREVAETEILPRFGTLKAHQIRTKSNPGDLVTDADIGAERELTRRLTDLLPGSVVVGEESCYQDRTILDRLSQEAPVWVLDPVDGTGNFARGRDSFGVIVALVHRGRTVFGCIHDPVRNLTIVGEDGAGAWCDGRRLTVPASGPLNTLGGTVGTRRERALEGRVWRLVRYASAAQDYLALLLGRIHFGYYRRLLPWDHAAGVMLHREAGGYAALVTGEPYRPVLLETALLLAPDRETWETLLPLLDHPQAGGGPDSSDHRLV